jgi:hypothetical protein
MEHELGRIWRMRASAVESLAASTGVRRWLEVELCERAWLLKASVASSPAPYALLLLLEVELRRDLEDAGECGGVPRSERRLAAAALPRARGLGSCSC